MSDPPEFSPELDDLTEHLERYRATTLQVFHLLDDEDLAWRPSRDQYSLGQQLLHIAQAEDRLARGLFEDDWSYLRAREGPSGVHRRLATGRTRPRLTAGERWND